MPAAIPAVVGFLGSPAGAATISGVASLGSSAIASRSAKKAGERQTVQDERALAILEEREGRTQESLQPFLRGETPEQREIAAFSGLSGDEARAEAEARLESPTTRALKLQGFQALDRRLASVGQLGGSNRLRAIINQSTLFDDRRKGERIEDLERLGRSRFDAAQVEAGFGTQTTGARSAVRRGIGDTESRTTLDRGRAFQSGVENLGSLALSTFKRPNTALRETNITF